jgi:DNA-binding Lrp family transcriptional regulator
MSPRKFSLDQLDYDIIQALHKDARVSASEIARETGANERTIRKRIDRLIEENIFRLTAIINPTSFGYITAADILLEADPSKEDEIVQRLFSMPEITYVAFGQGSQEISIEARFKNNGEMREFLRKILPSIPGVTVSRYALVPRILRNIDEWVPPKEDFGIEE